MTDKSPLKVAITGAAGNIGYALIFRIAAQGLCAGRPVELRLIEQRDDKRFQALGMELDDCAYPMLADYRLTCNFDEGFADADVVVLAGAKPRTEGMERKDLLLDNGAIFERQGAILNEVASATAKVVVVGNPANTNALIACANAPKLPATAFSCLTRLDHNRACAMLAQKLGLHVSAIKKMIIWCNHSSTQFPDLLHCEVGGSAPDVDAQWFKEVFVPAVQSRGSEVIAARGSSSAASAASAVVDHLHSWLNGTPDGDWTSMGMISDGSYGIEEGLMASFPVTIDAQGNASIVQGLDLNAFEQQMIAASVAELCEERDTVKALLQ